MTGELADLAEQAIEQTGAVLDNARRALARVAGRQRGRLHKAVNELSTVVIRAARVVAQGRLRVAGQRIESATRLVSLHDPDARPIVKGKLGTPVEPPRVPAERRDDGAVADAATGVDDAHAIDRRALPRAAQLGERQRKTLSSIDGS